MKDIEYKKDIKITNIHLSHIGSIVFTINDEVDMLFKSKRNEWDKVRDIKTWDFNTITKILITPEAIDMMIKEMWGDK